MNKKSICNEIDNIKKNKKKNKKKRNLVINTYNYSKCFQMHPIMG